MQVDHIQPLSKYPELALVEDNLQVLCKDCNMGKSNQYADDFRAKPSPAAPVLVLDDQREAMALGRTLKQEITAAEAKGDGPRQAELMRQARH